ncbi:AAA family ATPase [Peptacetobacter hiranonis]|uniref:AAA family ATPase n=1 Tax=Peptacetobacter hiranonis TaxID=89152 RepID=UPI00191779C3|nr:AAA family ATPase [Peptacetobacter hiranonis]QQQ86350.1 AAA family ATPase [Peptacetobacter hiranonis]
MRIDRIALKNFFRYYGTQTIVFSKETNKNVTVIRGENGTGKTTLLNAFYYVMYGDVMEPLKIDNMLNLRAAEELKEGETISASVGMEFEERNERYLVNREEKFEKINGKIIHDKHKYIEIYRIDSITGNAEKENDDFIEKIIPKRLRSFFFFDGERINKLAQVDGKEEIKKAILDILGVTMLDNMSKDLEQIKSEYTKELKWNL